MTTNSTETASSHGAGFALPLLQLALLACLLLIVGSAIHVVYLSQQSRTLFAELETLRKKQDQLDTRWTRLTLERSTLLSPANVERVAQKKLSMYRPGAHEIVVIKP